MMNILIGLGLSILVVLSTPTGPASTPGFFLCWALMSGIAYLLSEDRT